MMTLLMGVSAVEDVYKRQARLSRFVENVTSGMPKSLLYKAFRNKRIKVNGKKGAPDTRLCPGDLVELYINDEFFSAAPPTARPLPYKKRPPLRMVYELSLIHI